MTRRDWRQSWHKLRGIKDTFQSRFILCCGFHVKLSPPLVQSATAGPRREGGETPRTLRCSLSYDYATQMTRGRRSQLMGTWYSSKQARGLVRTWSCSGITLQDFNSSGNWKNTHRT